ncbi:NAD-binding protein [bacterium]|nr:NAD-binding protein [bacterium]MBU1994583.1 NAD-binding protein [bacterium]
MKKITALIFGYNDYAFEIAKNIEHKYRDICIFKLNSDEATLQKKNYKIKNFDFSDEWDELKNTFDMQKSIAFCVLEDDAENIFLTISLRSSFKDLSIIALSKNKESANKLSMAGANKVIPVVQTTASIIADMLKKPVVTEVLHDILYEKSDLKIAQIQVEKDNFFDGKYPADIEWSREHGIIVLSIMHEDMSSEFIYSSKVQHHVIKNGDIFVVVGYENEIKEFEKSIGSRCDVDWDNWSR